MKNSHSAKHGQPSKMPKSKDVINSTVKSNAQIPSFINEGNPNTQNISVDQQSAREVKQAIKDDPLLAPVAADIHVAIKDGEITLGGKVATDQQMNRVAGTAIAVGVVDQVTNNIEVTHAPEFQGRVPFT